MSAPFPPEHGRPATADIMQDGPAVPVSDAASPPSAPPPKTTWWAGVNRRAVLACALIGAVLVAGVWLDGRRAQQGLRTEVAKRLGELETAGQVGAKTQAQLAAELRDASAKIALLEARLAESQEQQASLEALYRDLAPSRTEIALTEIEQILVIASQQLQLAGNVSAALAALQLAEAKLQRLERPQFLPLRRALARDIETLKAVPFVDVPGIALKLDQAMAVVDNLPMAVDERVPAAASAPGAAPARDASWRGLLRELWSDVRELIRIEVTDRPAAPLLPPSQQYFLRENLKLRLLSARVALLNHDDASFKADIAAAETVVRQYFDVRAKPVQAVQAALKQLGGTPAAGEIPDLARSLEAMRVLRLGAERSGRAVGERSAR